MPVRFRGLGCIEANANKSLATRLHERPKSLKCCFRCPNPVFDHSRDRTPFPFARKRLLLCSEPKRQNTHLCSITHNSHIELPGAFNRVFEDVGLGGEIGVWQSLFIQRQDECDETSFSGNGDVGFVRDDRGRRRGA